MRAVMVPNQAFININKKLQLTIKRQNMNPDKLMVKVIIYFPTATNFNECMNSALQEKDFIIKSDKIKLKFGFYSRLRTFIVINKIWIFNVLFKIGLLLS